jgi:hypothetical protein
LELCNVRLNCSSELLWSLLPGLISFHNFVIYDGFSAPQAPGYVATHIY